MADVKLTYKTVFLQLRHRPRDLLGHQLLGPVRSSVPNTTTPLGKPSTPQPRIATQTIYPAQQCT